MSTATTVDLMKTIVARLIAAGITRVYVSQAPDLAVFPYAVVRKINAQSAPEYQNARENFELEMMFFGRPRATEQAVEALADTAVASMLTWVESGATLGLSFTDRYSRDSLPPPGDPGDRELVQVRVLFECSSWPRYLTVPLTA
jgi:hypothetical protein